ncbi:TPA: leucine--tRNA ligase [candidate division WWE3 bacterium]|nr:leucine--tRNA ligase [candidate division WWE3 bacterium]
MEKKYDHKQIENKWKEFWYRDNIYKAVDFSEKPKKYILAELPYPSGPYLHAGHMMRYTVPDVYSRYLRMNGYNVMYPMGWDAFGLPTEGYALKMGKTPQEVTEELAKGYKQSAQDFGYGIDWDREITTSDPKYYKWTQWLFLKFFENGLAVQEEMPVWWCKELGVLAEEEVLTGKDGQKVSERGGYAVERKLFKQWVLRIPAYAEKLIDGLKETDFPDYIKTAQINWIGKSIGAEVEFKAVAGDKNITVFTTRIDTIYGASAVIISPEYENLYDFVAEEQRGGVEQYVKAAKQKSEMERTAIQKDKSGVFAGTYVLNPFSGEKHPVWVADFVLTTYGTGAIMCVPGHDERDHEFSVKYGLKIGQVVMPADGIEVDVQKEPYTGYGISINSGEYSNKPSEQVIMEMTQKAENENFGKFKINYKLRDWVFSRQRYWGEPIPVVYKNDGAIEAVVDTNDMPEVHKKLPVELPYTKDYQPSESGGAPLARLTDWVETTDKNGSPAKRETETMPTWAGSSWYYIRYCDPKNENAFADPEILKYWLPVDKYFGDGGHTTAHLLYSRFWHKFFYDLGLVPTPEPYKWRMTGGLLLGADGQKMSKSRGNVINPKEIVEHFGADACRLYLCFIGPYDETYPWDDHGVKATKRFIDNLFLLRNKVRDDEGAGAELEKDYNLMVKKVTAMCDDLKMNTCVSEFMIFANAAKKAPSISTGQWKGYIKLLAPFIPFVAEEFWHEINNFSTWDKNNSVHLQEWPKFDPSKLAENTVIIPVQINGKVRAEIEIDSNADERAVSELIKNNADLIKSLDGRQVRKLIYVKGKIVSLVV